MVVNTFIQRIGSKNFEQIGYRFLKFLSPRHWYQFADDAAVITGLESENQILLNEFSRWCTWAKMTIRIDKCHSFGMAKVSTASKQVKPKVYLNNKLVKPIGMKDSFTYLGKHFDFDMKGEKHKDDLIEATSTMLESIDRLPLHPRNKLLIYHRYILAKLSWDLTVSDISLTWVKTILDAKVHSFVRNWFEIPISGTLDIASLSIKKLGICLISVSSRFIQCQTTLRNCLKNSKNNDIRKIHKATTIGPKIKYVGLNSTRDVMKEIRSEKEQRVKQVLTTQSLVVKAIWEHSWKHSNIIWHSVLDRLPKNIYSFCLRYMNNTLANGSNILKWGKVESAKCKFCNNIQTLGHVIGSCKSFLDEGRYNFRHDSILVNVLKMIMPKENRTIYGDVPGYQNPSIITGTDYRPDIIITEGRSIKVLELTVGFETNIQKNTDYKNERYKPLWDEIKDRYDDKIEYINFSMGSIGTLGKSCENIKVALKDLGLTKTESSYLLEKIVNVCIRSTYFIFCKRNSNWPKPELMTW